ncbi:type IV pili methyl-accepting chemotaxis transducer N-terminal domain-containing protein [Yoonia litorea]|uniref:type IV pili methyl-accepting chemotaxis transducer N-terminal domain-containing protein n=1 Tax=Yoonia litorea TaxID=1123755 RepID=UPI0013F4F7EA|nr:type IV pili methyl-accepting chemotaxis transducer N-terminal domain-containing protein [Yoonia litorea]
MLRVSGSLATALVSGSLLITTPTFAQQSANSDLNVLTEVALASDASERLELVSRLRTLSQQLAAATCTLTSGVVPEEGEAVLHQAKQDFDRYIAALRYGDPELGTLVAETDRKILHDIDEVEAEWALVAEAVLAVLADPTDIESAHFVDDHNLKLLELTNQLASDVRGHYTNPFQVSARDSMMIELAGRQLMLTQKMAKDSFEIWTGYNAEAAAEDLAATMQIFGASLEALRHGLPAAGIAPAPNDVIAEDLDGLLSRWSVIEANLQAQLDGAVLSEEQKALVFHEFQVELAELKLLLTHYREHAERLL